MRLLLLGLLFFVSPPSGIPVESAYVGLVVDIARIREKLLADSIALQVKSFQGIVCEMECLATNLGLWPIVTAEKIRVTGTASDPYPYDTLDPSPRFMYRRTFGPLLC